MLSVLVIAGAMCEDQAPMGDEDNVDAGPGAISDIIRVGDIRHSHFLKFRIKISFEQTV